MKVASSFQGYQLCALDYDFHVLNTPFLLHRPGIKTKAMAHKANSRPFVVKAKRVQDKLIKDVIAKELKRVYGDVRGCSVH